MKIIDKNGKQIKIGSRVQTDTTASPTARYPGTVTSFIENTTPGSTQPPHMRILFDTGTLGSFDCWETITGVYQAEEVELLEA